MTTSRAFNIIFSCCSAFALVACTAGSNISETNAVAKILPVAQQSGGLLAIANDMAAKGDHEAAIPLYRHIANTTRTPASVTGLANSLMAMGDLGAAKALLVDMMDHEGTANTSGETFYSYAKVSLAQGNFQAALNGFHEASLRLSADPRPISGRAIAMAALGDSTGALSAFGSAVDASSLSNKALILAATGKPEAAINILEPLMAAADSTPRDRQNLAMAYLQAGREEQAYTLARLDLDPASINTTFTFYRSLNALSPAMRMQALVTGVINPAWNAEEAANLTLENTSEKQAAAARLTAEETTASLEPATIRAAPPEEAQKTTPSPADYGLSEVPPLVESEGWALQIGAYRTIDRLMRGWSILLQRNSDILADTPPRRSEVDFGEASHGGFKKGTPSGFYFRLNAGPLASFIEAKTLCDELIARGTPCWIRPPEKTEKTLSKTDGTAENMS